MPFESQNTQSEVFYLQKEQEKEKQVDMMNLYLTELEYLSNDFMEGVLLPYQKSDENSNNSFAFIALKPTGESDIREVYQKLTDEVISDILVNRSLRHEPSLKLLLQPPPLFLPHLQ